MMSLKRVKVLLIIFWFLLNKNIFAQPIYPSSYDKSIVIVPEGQSRTFMFTNQKGLFFYGETGQPNISQYQGLSYLTYEYLEDYIIEISDVLLSRSQAEVHLMGDKLIRHFKSVSVEEEISMADSLPILTIKIRSKQKTPMAIAPLISGSNQKQDFEIDWSNADKVLYIARKNHLARNDNNNSPIWLGVCSYPEGEYSATGLDLVPNKFKLAEEKVINPGKINIYLESEALIFFIIGDTKNDVLETRNIMLENLNIEINKQKSQIEGVRQARSNFYPIFTGLLVPPF